MLDSRAQTVDAPELSHAVAVGAVDARSARIWLRAPGAAGLQLVLLGPDGSDRHLPITARPTPEADHTLSIAYPDDFPGSPELSPNTRYGFRVQSASGVIGQGRFETAPSGAADTPQRFCFGFASCHQPFDNHGGVAPDPAAMLQAAHRALLENDAKFLLLLGDQVYADEPACYSVHGPAHKDDRLQSELLGQTRQEIRRRFHRQYRRSWAVAGWETLTANRSTRCIPDDHEIIDNWGSDPAHAGPQWQQLAAGALDAYWDYQGARTGTAAQGRPPALYHTFGYGTIAVFIADVRGERQAVPALERVMGEQQIAALARFLANHGDRHALFVSLSVPIVHIPGWLNSVGEKLIHRGGDLQDRWSSPAFRPQRDRVLAMLAEHQRIHPGQKLTLLSGDIHAGWACTLQTAGAQPIVQFVSSALTNRSRSMAGPLARAMLEATRPLEREVAGLQIAALPGKPGGTNPYGGLNLGLVDIERQGDTSRVRFKLIGQDPADPTQPVVVFESLPMD
jgi:alkaline phosphatase D